MEFATLLLRHLHAAQHAAKGGAVSAVVKEADIPVRIHMVEKIQQGAGAFGKFKPVKNLVGDVRRVAAHHITHMQLGGVIVAQIDDCISFSRQAAKQFLAFRHAAGLDADEDPRRLIIAVAVVELGYLTLAQRPAKGAEAAGAFRDGDGEHRLAPLA